MVEFEICKSWREEGFVMRGLDSFYIFGAILLLMVALVYWADAIRAKKEKKR